MKRVRLPEPGSQLPNHGARSLKTTPSSPVPARRLFGWWFALAIVLVAADQGVKMLILQNFAFGDTVSITPFFNLVRAHNTGAAFSLLAGAGGWQRWLFTAIAVIVGAFIAGMLWRHSHEKLLSLALACILGGAVGNLIDRQIHGYVVDFLDFHWGSAHFPAFNLADSAIVIGAGLIILNELLQIMRGKASSSQNSQ